jgi:hypothetical protein
MGRDLATDIDRLSRQLAELRSTLAGQAGDAAGNAATYIAPRALQFARQFQKEAPRLVQSASRNPSAATGAVVGAMLIGAAFVWLLSSNGGRSED